MGTVQSDAGSFIHKPLQGVEEANIDDKNRLLFSKKKRERLGDDFVVALGPLGCLVAYPRVVWRAMMDEIEAAKPANVGRQQYARMLLGYMDDELKFDLQGRLVIPHRLRSEAKLKDKAVLVGAFDRVEIWNPEEYAGFSADPKGYGNARSAAMDLAYAEMVEGTV